MVDVPIVIDSANAEEREASTACISTWDAGGSELHQLIRAYNWDAAIKRIESHPEELFTLDRRGRSIYMTAAAKGDHDYDETLSASSSRLPMKFISLVQNRIARKSLTARDKTGLTALIMAIQSNASLEFLESLLRRGGHDQVLTRNHQGNLPIHLVLKRGYSNSYFACLDENPSRRREIMDFLLRVGDTKQQLLLENSQGETPLHVCLGSSLTEDLVQSIAQACPEAITRNACGSIPLMLAIERDYEVHLIEFLVNLQPSVTKIPSCSGKYPLRRCLEQTRRRRHNREIVRMLCTCPEVVDAVDSLGRNAVQLVLEQWHGCRCLIDTTMLEILLAHSPRAAQPPDIQSKCSTSIIRTTASPIRLCYKSYKAAVADLEGWNHQIGSSTVTRRRAQQLVHLWREICLIVLRTMGDNILWGALQTSAPLSILEWILQDDPSLIRTRNAQGDLPLHWACSHLHYNGNEVFDLLIQADPGQASISGRNGMFPLHHCVQSDALLSPCRLRRLVHLYPAALSRRDPSSGLFPFQIASSGSREIGEQGLVTKHAQLDQIFSVMLMAPGLVNEAI